MITRRLLLTLVLGYTSVVECQAAHRPTTLVEDWEAKFLVSMTDEIASLVGSGKQVLLNGQSSSVYNTDDFFVYWAHIQTDAASGNIGSFAVNKHTAEVWDLAVWIPQSNAAIKQSQELLRRNHNISAGVIAKYHDLLGIRGEGGPPMAGPGIPRQRLAHFEVVVSREANRVTLECMYGCAWTRQTLPCTGPDTCIVVYDEMGQM